MLVGRGAELKKLREITRAGGFPLLVGPPGIGKTFVARHALGAMGEFHEGGALATLQWVPYLMFKRLLASSVPEDVQLVAAKVLSETSGPLLLDDLQWADSASIEVVGALMDKRQLVGTARTGENGSTVVVDWLVALGAEVIELKPLSTRSARELGAMAHKGISAAELAKLVKVAGGNPLLLEALEIKNDSPTNLVSALLSRVDELDDVARESLERLAILGRPVDLSTVGASAQTLLDAGLARMVGERIATRHDHLGEVIVDLLGTRADETRLSLVPLVGPIEGAHLLERVGETATARARALKVIEDHGAPSDRDRLELLELIVRCEAPGEVDANSRFQLARLLTKYRRPLDAITVCDPPGMEGLGNYEQGQLLLARAEAHWGAGQLVLAAESGERSLELLAGSGTAMEVLALVGTTTFRTGPDFDLERDLQRSEQALVLALELGEEVLVAKWRLAAIYQMMDRQGWEEMTDEVIQQAREQGDRDLEHLAVVTSLLHRWLSGEPAVALALAERELRNQPDPDPTFSTLTLQAYRAMLGLQCGYPPEKLVQDHGGDLALTPKYVAQPYLFTTMAVALAELGRFSESRDLLDGIEGADELQKAALRGWAGAEISWAMGDDDGVLEALASVESVGAGVYPAGFITRLIGAHSAIAQGEVPKGDEPDPIFAMFAGVPVEWRAAVAQAEGRYAEAADLYRQAAKLWSTCDLRCALRCRWARAVCLGHLGEQGALSLLRNVEVSAAKIGCSSILSRARSSLRSLGANAVFVRERGVGPLTARQVDVLRLVGEGLSSAQIAAVRGVAPSTVESSIRSARRVLNAPTRLAAVAELQRLEASMSD
ncbi:MAG: hypothetical protein KDA95_02460 [Acidimicrobiales bacterium]|nr:hypothetical protein [Acidimicrobiales bacterium]